MPSSDDIKAAQRAAWAKLSAGWDKWDRIIRAQLNPVGEAIIESLGVTEDHHHLDIASGTGEPGLSIARLTPRGRVVLTDLAPQMLEVAARRAASEGLVNVETQVCSADDLPFESASFDSVSVRFGYMFFPDRAKATDEFVRVLKPGGRVCASVWIRPEANPWTSIVLRAIATEVELPPTDPDGPNMFRCAAPGHVSDLYASAGLREIVEWDVNVELVTASPEQYWDVMSEHMSLAMAALESVDEEARQRIRAMVIAEARDYVIDGRVAIPGVARCILGTK